MLLTRNELEVLLDPAMLDEKTFLLTLCGFTDVPSALRQCPALQEKRLDWDLIRRFSFSHPFFVHYFQNAFEELAVPPELAEKAAVEYKFVALNNIERVNRIYELAGLSRALNLPVLFVKGAAELAYFQGDPQFLHLRKMDDIDLVCEKAHLAAFDEALVNSGRIFHPFAYDPHDPAAKQEILERVGHYVYDIGTVTRLELHTQIATAKNEASYPPGFTRLLLEHQQPVALYDRDIQVPKLEHLFVYAVCHAACLKDFDYVIFQQEHPPHSFLRLGPEADALAVSIHRYNLAMLFNLVKMHYLFQVFGPRVDWEEIGFLLDQVPVRTLLDNFLAFMTVCSPKTYPILPQEPSIAAIAQARLDYIQSYQPA